MYHVMEDQLLSADDGHLSFCTMQCNELVLTLKDGDKHVPLICQNDLIILQEQEPRRPTS